MTGYELSRKWFDFAYENIDSLTPTHSALYFYITDQCNRRGWPSKFGLPSQMTMDCIGVRNYKTYKAALDDLIDWGFIKLFEKSKNQHSSNIIGLVKNTKATTKALSIALQEQLPKQEESTAGINKLLNLQTNKQETVPVSLQDFLKYGYEKVFQIKKVNGELFEELLTSKYFAWAEAGWKKQNEHGELVSIKNWKSTLLNVIPHFKTPSGIIQTQKSNYHLPPRKNMCDSQADYDMQWEEYKQKYPDSLYEKE